MPKFCALFISGLGFPTSAVFLTYREQDYSFNRTTTKRELMEGLMLRPKGLVLTTALHFS